MFMVKSLSHIVFPPTRPQGADLAFGACISVGLLNCNSRHEAKPVTVHHFTVDVEEHFQVTALEKAVRPEQWDLHPSRVAESTRRLTDLMARHGARGTFFVLGWVAERQPELVRELSAAGHEIASHGWDHGRVPAQTPAHFRQSVRRSKALLEDLTGREVVGFRAPSFSIVPGVEWAFDILLEEGHRYDSSLFPIRRRGYGYPSAGRDPHALERSAGTLLAVPPATVRIGRLNLPAGGGGYFRLLPYALTQAAFTQAERRGSPATFYIHPWELDADQPRLPVAPLTRIRHYGGLRRTADRLERLLGSYRFQPIAETLELLRPAGAMS
jgi:polysaccharide deacetylase family protein (PEP-CTERM system associated)